MYIYIYIKNDWLIVFSFEGFTKCGIRASMIFNAVHNISKENSIINVKKDSLPFYTSKLVMQ